MFVQQQKAPLHPHRPLSRALGGSLRQSPSISPALMAFNMLMTLKRAGAALCKTRVLHSVMDVCARHGVKYLSSPPPPDSTALTIAIATGPFPLAGNMWLPDHDSERYRLYL